MKPHIRNQLPELNVGVPMCVTVRKDRVWHLIHSYSFISLSSSRYRKLFPSAQLPSCPELTLLCLQTSDYLMQWIAIFSSCEHENSNSSSMHNKEVNNLTEVEKSLTKQSLISLLEICYVSSKMILQPAKSMPVPHIINLIP